MSEVKISDIMEDLNQKVDAVYRHNTLLERYATIPRDYGEGFILTEPEAHIIGYICQMEEATVTDLAQFSFRTKGSISKLLKRLEEKELITRQKKEGNNKWVYIRPTEKGLRANIIHQAYDRAATSVMMEELLKTCTPQDIESFYKVTQARIEYLAGKQQEAEGE